MTTTYRCRCGIPFVNGWQLREHQDNGMCRVAQMEALEKRNPQGTPLFHLPRHPFLNTAVEWVKELGSPGTVITYQSNHAENILVVREHMMRLMLVLGWPYERDGGDLKLHNKSRMAFQLVGPLNASPVVPFPKPC